MGGWFGQDGSQRSPHLGRDPMPLVGSAETDARQLCRRSRWVPIWGRSFFWMHVSDRCWRPKGHRCPRSGHWDNLTPAGNPRSLAPVGDKTPIWGRQRIVRQYGQIVDRRSILKLHRLSQVYGVGPVGTNWILTYNSRGPPIGAGGESIASRQRQIWVPIWAGPTERLPTVSAPLTKATAGQVGAAPTSAASHCPLPYGIVRRTTTSRAFPGPHRYPVLSAEPIHTGPGWMAGPGSLARLPVGTKSRRCPYLSSFGRSRQCPQMGTSGQPHPEPPIVAGGDSPYGPHLVGGADLAAMRNSPRLVSLALARLRAGSLQASAPSPRRRPARYPKRAVDRRRTSSRRTA